MSGLVIELIGPPHITVDGAPLEVDTRKAIALLAYLAAGEAVRSRDHLAGFLWPESSEERARAALRRTLAVLRAGLGGRWVYADRRAIRLAAEDTTNDVVLLNDAVGGVRGHGHDPDATCAGCIPVLRDAVGLVRGDFLEGFYIGGAEPFDEWVRTRAESVRLTSGALFDRLAEAEVADGDYDGATGTLRRRIGLDRLHEPAYRRLMLVRAWAGDRAGAVEAYRRCVGVLQEELGVAPLEETTELYEAVLDEDLPRAPGLARRAALALATPAPPPELVGRSAEWARLVEAVDRGLPVVVHGATGTGRTRMLDELAASLAAAQRPLLMAGARQAGIDAGYGVLQPLLEQAVRLPGTGSIPRWARAEIGRLVPDAFDAVDEPPRSDPTQGRRLADAAIRAIAASGAVVIIDDAQWCDAASALVLARALDETGVAMVAAIRSDDESSDHPLLSAFAASGPAGSRAVTIELGPLDETAVGLLAAGRSTIDVADLYRVTKGVPLFVAAYIDAGLPSTDDVPPQIRSLFVRRIDALPKLARQVLTAIAAVGRPSLFSIIREVSGRSEAEVLDAVDLLLERRMLREDIAGDLDVGHPLLGDTALYSATQVRRRILHRRIAAALGRTPGSPGITVDLEIARHLDAAGEIAEAASWYVRAGDRARSVHAIDEAESAYRAALASEFDDAGRLHLALGDLAVLTGRFDEALLEYETAAAGSTGERLGSVEHRLGELLGRLGRWDAAGYHFTLADAEHPNRSTLLADWSLLEFRKGDRVRSTELAERALREAVQAEEIARAHNVLGVVAVDPGRAEDHLHLSLAAAGDDPNLCMAALNNLSEVVARRGDVEAAVGLARDALALAVTVGDRHRQAALHDRLAGLHRAAGLLKESEAASIEAAGLFAGLTGPDDWEPELWRLVQW